MSDQTFARAVQLFRIVDEFGPMHIVVSDGNVDDNHLDFVAIEMEKRGASMQEHELIALLRLMTTKQREKAWTSSNLRDDR